MTASTQANTISHNKTISSLTESDFYENKFPVWSTFYTTLPLLILSSSISAIFLYLFSTISNENLDACAKKGIYLYLFFLFSAISAGLCFAFYAQNFEVPVETMWNSELDKNPHQ